MIICHMEKIGRNARGAEKEQKIRIRLKSGLAREIWVMEGIFLNHIVETVG
mgnify:CR=1 FL=1